MKTSIHADLDAFHSGFQACAKEVLQYLNKFENWNTREQRCAQLINHLHKVSAQFQPSAPLLHSQQPAGDVLERDGQKVESQAGHDRVSVIQRSHGELNENDTDTDSGYGGEAEKTDGNKGCDRSKAVKIKQEFGDDRAAKKTKMSWAGNSTTGADTTTRPDLAFMNSLMGITGVGQQTPFCMPFYFINPSAAASYMPLFDKNNLEKFVYPAAAAATISSQFHWLYPGLNSHASAAAAATAGVFSRMSTEKISGLGSDSKDSPSDDSDMSNVAEPGSPDEREDNLENDEDDDDDYDDKELGDDSLDNENDST